MVLENSKNTSKNTLKRYTSHRPRKPRRYTKLHARVLRFGPSRFQSPPPLSSTPFLTIATNPPFFPFSPHGSMLKSKQQQPCSMPRPESWKKQNIKDMGKTFSSDSGKRIRRQRRSTTVQTARRCNRPDYASWKPH